MNKIIPSLKIILLSCSSNISLVLNQSQLENLHKFVNFCVCIYLPWWIKCPLAASAPLNDLLFITDIKKYKEATCSTEALKAFSRHLDYLTEELIPLGLFSDEVSDIEKQNLALQIQSIQVS